MVLAVCRHQLTFMLLRQLESVFVCHSVRPIVLAYNVSFDNEAQVPARGHHASAAGLGAGRFADRGICAQEGSWANKYCKLVCKLRWSMCRQLLTFRTLLRRPGCMAATSKDRGDQVGLPSPDRHICKHILHELRGLTRYLLAGTC